MARSRLKTKGRKSSGTFFQLPHAVLRSHNYISLSHIARSLLIEFSLQFNGKNNGDLTAVWSDLSRRGWVSKSTVSKHIDELLHYGFIVLVQRGGINVGGKQRPNLYALTWLSIDNTSYCDDYLGRTVYKLSLIHI